MFAFQCFISKITQRFSWDLMYGICVKVSMRTELWSTYNYRLKDTVIGLSGTSVRTWSHPFSKWCKMKYRYNNIITNAYNWQLYHFFSTRKLMQQIVSNSVVNFLPLVPNTWVYHELCNSNVHEKEGCSRRRSESWRLTKSLDHICASRTAYNNVSPHLWVEIKTMLMQSLYSLLIKLFIDKMNCSILQKNNLY